MDVCWGGVDTGVGHGVGRRLAVDLAREGRRRLFYKPAMLVIEPDTVGDRLSRSDLRFSGNHLHPGGLAGRALGLFGYFHRTAGRCSLCGCGRSVPQTVEPFTSGEIEPAFPGDG